MLIFHHSPMSSNSQKVRFFLEETGIPFEARLIDLRTAAQTRPDFLEINPFGAVPVIEYQGFRMAESNSILRYLAERFDKQEWYPRNLEERARVNELMDFCSNHVSRWLTVLNWYELVCPMLGMKGNEAVCQEARGQLERYLPRMELYMRRTSTYLCGGHPTIADASFVAAAQQTKTLKVALRDYPLVQAYVDRLLARPAWQKLHGEVMALLRGK